MSDKQISDLDIQDENMLKEVAKKLDSKTKREVCPYCDNKMWFLLNKTDQHPVLMLKNFGNFPTYSLACTNCGFIRQHLSIVVDGEIVGGTEFFVPEETV